MNDVFTSLYADTYDDLYVDKDYDRETSLLKRLFNEHAEGAVTSVLDLGCGTGNHLVRLARDGYEVTGIELSEDMLQQARAKTYGMQNVSLQAGDMRGVDLGRTFDVALFLFAVLGYGVENDDVISALRSARAHVRPGGLVIFDVWYGPAVLVDRPTTRFAVVDVDGGKLLRAATPALDTRRHVCQVSYELWRLEDDRVVDTWTEQHAMRFFFPRELELMLDVSGFSLIRLSGFPELDAEPNERTWTVMAVARAR